MYSTVPTDLTSEDMHQVGSFRLDFRDLETEITIEIKTHQIKKSDIKFLRLSALCFLINDSQIVLISIQGQLKRSLWPRICD